MLYSVQSKYQGMWLHMIYYQFDLHNKAKGIYQHIGLCLDYRTFLLTWLHRQEHMLKHQKLQYQKWYQGIEKHIALFNFIHKFVFRLQPKYSS